MQIPSSTYRIQLNEHFTFQQLGEIIDYLYELGISTIYASPVTTAFKGSTHGYDVTDPLRLNPEIGTEQEWEQLTARLRQYKMTWLQDIVPNHMSYDNSNPWLYDVLERGKDSVYHTYFDIDTDHPVELLGDRLMAPFLGTTLTECLQEGELTLQFTGKGFVIRYYDKDYPVAARLYRWICTVAEGYPEALTASLDRFEDAMTAPPADWTTAKEEWLRQVNDHPDFLVFIKTRLAFFNSRQNLLGSLVQDQHYVLTHAHLAVSHINYRRFFTINSLICLRMENEAVFNAWHETIRKWYAKGWIQGLRIDHIDGLAAPKDYLYRLRAAFGPDCYVIAEKILTREETNPEDWPQEGTTGYDFLSFAGQVLTDPDGSRQLLGFYKEQIAASPDYETIVFDKKYTFLCRYMGGELDNLVNLLTHLSSLHAAVLDRPRLKEALAALMASFPVYRVYPDGLRFSVADRKVIEVTFTKATQLRPEHQPELTFLRELFDEDHPGEKSREKAIFLNRLLQFTGPLAAKGIEDTSFYVYNPYIAHNEVGDSPAEPGYSIQKFHSQLLHRQSTYPYSLNATTTHDTKRGEDSRVRLTLLSAKPQQWITAVVGWREINRPLVIEVKGRQAPSTNDEYLIYQALLGSFPSDMNVTDEFRERFAGYLTKALREAKTETSYENPDEAYESQCQNFVKALLQPGSAFLEDFEPFVSAIIHEAAAYSLSLLLLKLTAPGIPDIYQGAELWETSLVDPDNRRPVDFTLRRSLLRQLKEAEATAEASADQDFTGIREFLHHHRDKGADKLFILHRTLHWRRDHPQVFLQGDYIPLTVEGPLLAYIRRSGDSWALIVVPAIRYEQPMPGKNQLTLPPEAPTKWKHLFTNESFRASGDQLELYDTWSKSAVTLLIGDKT